MLRQEERVLPPTLYSVYNSLMVGVEGQHPPAAKYMDKPTDAIGHIIEEKGIILPLPSTLEKSLPFRTIQIPKLHSKNF